MSTTVEQRVVKFEFNNANFEENVKQSIGTLDNLKKTISESTSGAAFDDLSKASKKLDFSGVSETITTITSKFSILEEMAIGALRNIGVSIVNDLGNALKSVTLDDAIAGWDRYGQKTESVATIMAAIGDDDYGGVDKLEYVNEVLEKLAWFSDETSYNFNDMTDNIGKFVAAGLDLDTSTSAMMGIASWAAQAGQNAGTASRAMYQLSQAMGSGSIKLADWKSIEVANMATKEVKEMLIDYGKLMGQIETVYGPNGETQDIIKWIDSQTGKEKSMEITVGNFRDTLTSSGWLTSEVFSTAMAEYASYGEALNAIINNPANEKLDLYATDVIKKMDAAMKKSEETGETLDDIMMRDYGIDIRVEDENGNLVSAMRDVTSLGMAAFKAAQKARTFGQAVDSIHDAAATKWSQAFEKIFGNMEEATELWTYLSEVMYEWFAEPLNRLNDMLRSWNEFGGRNALFGYVTEEGEEVNGALQNIVEALNTYKEGIGKGLRAIFNPKGLNDEQFGEKLAGLSERFRDFTEGLILDEGGIKRLAEATKTFFEPVKGFIDLLKNVLGSAKSFTGGILEAFSKSFKYAVDDSMPEETKLRAFGNSLKSLTGTRLPKKLKALENPLKTVSKFFTNLTKVGSKFFKAFKPSEKVIERLTSIFTGFKYVLNMLFAPLRLVNSALEALLNPQSNKIENFAAFLSGPLLEAILWLPAKIGDVITKFSEFIRQSEIFGDIKDIFVAAWNAVKDFVEGFFGAAWDTIGPIFTGIKDAVGKFFGSFKSDSASPVLKKIHGWLTKIKDWFSKTDFKQMGATAFGGIVKAFEAVGDAIKKLVDKIKGNEKLMAFLKSIGDAISKFYNKIKTWITENLDFSSIGAFFDSLRIAVGKLKDKIGDSKIFKTVSDGIKTVYSSAKKWVSENIDFSSIPGFFSSLGKAIGSLIGKIKDSELFTKITDGLKNLFDAVKQWASENLDFTSISGFFASLGPAIKVGLEEIKDSDFFKTITENLKNAYEAVKTWMTENLHLGGLFEFFEDLSFDTLGEKISGFATTVWNSVQKVIGAIAEFLGIKKKSEGAGGITGRKKKISGQAEDVDIFGEGLGIGPVGEEYEDHPLGSVLSIAKEMFDEAAPMLDSLEKVMDGTSGVIERVGGIGDTIKTGFGKFKEFIEWIIDQAGEILPKVSGFILSLAGLNIGVGIKWIGSGIADFGDAVEQIGKAAKKFGKAKEMEAAADIIKSVALLLLSIAASLFIMSKLDNMDSVLIGATAAAILVGEVFAGLYLLVKSSSGVTKIADAASFAGLAAIVAAIAALMLAIAQSMKMMVDASNALGEGKSLWVDVILPIMAFIGEIFAGLAILAAASKGTGNSSLKGAKGAIVAIAAAVKIFAQIAEQLGKMDSNTFKNGAIRLGVITLALDGLMLSLGLLCKGNKATTLLAASVSLLILSGVVEILVQIVKQLGAMDGMQLGQGELALGIIVLLMLGLGQVGKGNKDLLKASAALAIMSACVVVLATVVANLGALSLEELGKGLGGLALIVLIMAEMAKIGKGQQKLIVTAVALDLMAGAAAICAVIVAQLGELSLETLGKGLVALYLIVLIMGEMAKIGKGKGSIVQTGFALDLMSGAAAICAIIVAKLGELSIETLAIGLVALYLIVLIMGEMAKIGSREKSLTKTAAALALMSGAAGIAALVVEQLAKIVRENDLGTILAAMLIFAGIIAVFVIAQKLIGDSKGTAILAIAAAIIAISLALLILAKTIDIFIDILIKLGDKIAGNKEKIKNGIKELAEILDETQEDLTKILTSLVKLLLSVLGTLIEDIAKGIVDLLIKVLKLVVEYGPEILKLLGTILKDIVKFILEFCEDELLPALQQLISDILTVLFNLLDELWTDIKAFITRLWNDIKLFLNMALIDIKVFLNNVIKAIEEVVTNILATVDNLVKKLTETITSIIDSITTMLSDIVTLIVDTLVDIVTTISDGLLDVLTTIKNTLVGENGEGGIIGILSDLITDVIDAAINLGEAIITGIIDGLADLVTKVHDSLVGEDGQGGLIGALKSLVTDVIAAALDLGAAIITGIIDGLADLVTRVHDSLVGEDGQGGLIGAIKSLVTDVIDAALELGKAVITGILNGLADLITEVKNSLVGENGEGGLIGAIKDLVTDVIDAALELGKAVITGILNGLADLVTEVTNSLVGEDGQGGLIGALKESVTKVTSAALDLGASIISNIIDGLGDLVTKVKNSLVGEDGKGGIVKGISDCITDVVTAVATLAGEIVKGLLDGISTIADDFHDGLVGEDGQGGLVKALCDVAKDLAPGVAAIVKALLDGLMDSVGTIVDTLVEMIVGRKDENGNVIKRGVLQYIDTILDAICQVLEWIPTAIKKYSKRIENAGWDILDAILSSIPLIGALWDLGRDAVKSLIGGLEEEADKYKDIDVMEKLGLGEGAVKELGKQGYRDRYHMFGADLITALMTGIQEKNPDALEALDLACEGLIDEARAKLGIKSPSTVFKDIGKNVDLGLAEGMTDNEGKINKSAAALLRSLKGQFTSEETRESLATTGEKVTKYISKGFISETSASSVSSAVQKMLRGVTTATKDSKDMISTSGMYVDKYVASGVKNKDNKQTVLDAVVSLAGAMLASFKGVDFTSSGDNFVSGVTSGIEHSAYLARQKAAALARDTKFAFDQELEIASPSKKMMESGRFFDMGLAKGIDKYSKDPIESSEDVADALALAMTAALYMAQAALQDEDYTPVITPVVDLTDVQNGVYQMGNLFGAYDGYSVDAAFGSRYNPYEYYDGSEKRDPTLDLLGSVDGVTSKLDQMINKLTQLKVYLDSGALVGGIYEQVDNSLGKKAIYAGRSVI